MALACFNVRQFDDAVQWSAIRKDPRPTYLTTLGSALLNLRRHDDALKVFDKAVQLKPVETECAEDAILCFRRAFEIVPNCWNSAYKAGALLRQQNRLAGALASFDGQVRAELDELLDTYKPGDRSVCLPQPSALRRDRSHR